MGVVTCTTRAEAAAGATHSYRVRAIRRGSVAVEPKKHLSVSEVGSAAPASATTVPPRTGPCHGATRETTGLAQKTIRAAEA